MANNTRKNCKKYQIDCLATQKKYAKKGTQLKCKLKTCRAKMYKSVYGAASGGSIRNPKIIFI